MSADLLTPRDLALAELIAERAAQRAVELLRQDAGQLPAPPLVSATVLAEHLGVDTKTIYRRTDSLGAGLGVAVLRIDSVNADTLNLPTVSPFPGRQVPRLPGAALGALGAVDAYSSSPTALRASARSR